MDSALPVTIKRSNNDVIYFFLPLVLSLVMVVLLLGVWNVWNALIGLFAVPIFVMVDITIEIHWRLAQLWTGLVQLFGEAIYMIYSPFVPST